VKRLLLTLFVLVFVLTSANLVMGQDEEMMSLIDCEQYDLSDYRIGLVTDVGEIDDGSFNESSWNGVLAAEECGAEVDYIQTESAEDYAENIAEFAENDYDIIVTVGFALGTATIEAAANYPDVMFIGVDQFLLVPDPDDEETLIPIDNAVGLLFHEDHSGFLAGVLAARLTQTGTIGAVLGTDQVPPVVAFKEGFEAGARYVNEDINILATYHPGSIDVAFTDPEWGATTARQQLDQDADVIFAWRQDRQRWPDRDRGRCGRWQPAAILHRRGHRPVADRARSAPLPRVERDEGAGSGCGRHHHGLCR
jgi:basic membrane lipoprotein Med (substrate-binding protein (PBP1-ABC) superfamily)